MKLYKFKSFENIEYTLDILLNERLYCAPHKALNDPFEGLFSTIEWKGGGIARSVSRPVATPVARDIHGNYPQKVFKTLDEVSILDKDIKVCSLTSSMNDVRMWSLYSAGHSGCAIEFDIEDTQEIIQVCYLEKLQHFKKIIENITTSTDILSYKTKHWEYEQEYRIITKNQFYQVKSRISAVYLGLRSKDIHKDIICRSSGGDVAIYETKLNQNNVTIQPNRRIK